MKYLVEVRKAKQDEKFLLRGHSGLTVEVAESETRMEHSVILAEISETDFSELICELEKYLNEVSFTSNLQSAINILKHLSK